MLISQIKITEDFKQLMIFIFLCIYIISNSNNIKIKNTNLCLQGGQI